MCKKLIYLVSFVLVAGLVTRASADLVGHWRLDEGAGDIANDSSGNGNHGTLQGDPQWTVGKIGPALDFNGSTDHITIPFSESLRVLNQGDFTIAAWFKPDEIPSENKEVVQQGDDTSGGLGRTWLFVAGANEIRSYLGNGTTGSGVGVEAGTWYHTAVVVTEGGATDTVQLYVNGEPVGEPNPMSMEDSEGTYFIGCHKNLTNFWDGIIDDVRLYNHALLPEEIQAAMQGIKGYPYALGPEPADGAFLEDTWANISWSPGDFAVSHDVYIGDNFDDVNDGAESTFQGNQTGTFIVVGFPGFAFPDGLVPGTTYYWRINEVNDTEPNSPWKGDVWSFSVPPKTAYAPDPADAAELVETDVELSWTGGFGSKLHTVYFGDNFDDVNNAAGGLPQGTATYTPGPLELAKTYYWRVDEFDVIETHKGDVWSFTTQGAVGNPNPSNGAVDVKQTQIITFSPSVFAASHQIYFGTDKDAVKNADTGSPEYKGTRDLGAESYDPGMLEWDTTYYWRIDEVNNTNTDSPWTGILWSFTTANFLIVDDFESYNDIDPPDPESKRIFEAWPDGYDIPTNGALVGNDLPPYAEQSIVHSGIQSMPLYYDNSVGYSEATHTLTYPRDWTENGVSTLSIWFRGNSDNAAETLYVALNGSAVVSHDNPNAAQVDEWTQWNIDLQAFADQGVNLANVNTIALGLGNKKNPVAGGSGTMYFDDIRLYPPPPAQ